MSNGLKKKKNGFYQSDPNSGKKLRVSAFTATIQSDGSVELVASGGFRLTYPKGSVLTGHIYQFIIEGNSDAIQMLATLHYSCCMIVPDEGFHKGIITLIDEYAERNKKPMLDDDEDEKDLDHVREYSGFVENVKEQADGQEE